MSVEFDPFGFFVKDFRTGARLMRCDSRGDLYPITTGSQVSSSVFAALSPSLWHSRLGHPSNSIFESLRLNKLIHCNKQHVSHICPSCSLGKHVRLSFKASTSISLLRLILFIVMYGRLLC